MPSYCLILIPSLLYQAMPQQPHIVSTFAAGSQVNIFDLKQHLNALDKHTGYKLRDPKPV